MLGFFDTAKPGQPLTNSVPPVLPSANWTTSALRTSGFSLLNSPARTRPCERFTRRLTTTGASLGVEVIGYSFLPAGLSPAVLPKLACRTQFDLPHTVVVGPDGRVYVGDRENFRLQVFDPDGEFIEQWTDVGSPWGLALSHDGALFIADGHNNRILKAGLDGTVRGQISSGGKAPGQVDFAHHIAIDSQDNVYVAEIKNWRVQKFVPRSD